MERHSAVFDIFLGEEPMKAGIITLYGNINYGNKLQNYAVAHLLGARGVAAETLVPRSQSYPVNCAWRTVRAVQRKMLKGLEKERTEGFEKFSRGIPVRYLLSDSAKRRSKLNYDFLVLGSDQIWHPRAFNLREERFGSFFPPDRVLCVSPSFGVSELPPDCLEYYRDGLSRLEWISVRESDGADLVRQLTGKNVPVLADPTIGVRIEEWESTMSEKRCPDSRYVLLYNLGGLGEEDKEALAILARRCNVTAIDVLDKGDARYYCADPGEFVGLIANAECVFTDSFHASVFSMLFNTPANILRRRGAANNVFSRLETFASTYGLEDRILDRIDPSEWDSYTACDYQRSWKIAEAKRKELNGFIDKFIESIR